MTGQNYNKCINSAIIRRKNQNTMDYEFKKYIKNKNPLLYREAVTELVKSSEKKRIINIINNQVEKYRRQARLVEDKKKFGQKILALHELLYELG
jgi:hypothetical protein